MRVDLTQSTHLERLKDVANMTTLPDIEEDECKRKSPSASYYDL